MTDNARILVVDDEPVIRTALVTVLEKENFQCASAASGEEAVEAFDADPFDVVITDIRMSGMSGVDLMRHVKSRSAEQKKALEEYHTKDVKRVSAADVAECIVWAATRPDHVNIDEIVVRPRDQATATEVHRC